MGKGNGIIGSYYLGGDDSETVSFFTLGVTEKVELTLNQYFQEEDWTGSIRYEIRRAGEDWWNPALIFGAYNIGSAHMTTVSITGIKNLSLPYVKDVRFHAGIKKETRSSGDTKAFGGISKALIKDFDFSVLLDGYDAHAILGKNYKGFRLNLMAYKMEHLSGGVSFQFEF